MAVISAMRLRQIIREYFTFSKGERVGLTILIVLMLIILIADRLVFYFERPAVADREKFSELMTELERQQAGQPTAGSLFPFDPNTIDSTGLDSLAVPDRVRQNLLKYRKQGGSFKAAADFRKIYGMNDSVFNRIENYIRIRRPSSAPLPGYQDTGRKAEVKKEYRSSPPVLTKIEINTATAADFMKLSGIGPVLSERIVKYRDLLGGFYSLEQLKEVYGLPEETLSRIGAQLAVDSTALSRININFAGTNELARHPYLGWKEARRIVDYRGKTGFIEDKYQLLQDSVLSSTIFRRVVPYLQTSD